ncbi:MAG: efflux RND transporter periplasmic adaptor subunit [Deferrisomatales bacterium]|nr:efflux RND transporter periplasmic adaptor subunit [Deferrisomatales bacterium]
MKRLLPFCVLAFLLFVACSDLGARPQPQAPQTAAVEAGDFVITVSATGKVEPETEVEVKSKASGEIVEFPFQAGDVVSAGEFLCALDPVDEQRNRERQLIEVEAAEARLAAARAALRVAEAERALALRDAEAAAGEVRARLQEALARLARDEGLLLAGVVSQEDVEASRTRAEEARASVERTEAARARARARDEDVERSRQEVRRAEADLEAARLGLQEAERRLAETRILAPLSGVITETLVEAGQVVSSALVNVGGGTTLLKIANLSRLYVLLAVDEVDIGQVRLGQTAWIRPEAFRDHVLEGRVVQIAPVGREEQQVVLFDVKVSVEGEKTVLLRPGMTADVEVEVARSAGTHWVPREAVDLTASRVRVVREGAEAEERTVEIGLRDSHRVEIRQGLSGGEQVVLLGPVAPSAWRRDAAPSRAAETRARAGFLRRLGGR